LTDDRAAYLSPTMLGLPVCGAIKFAALGKGEPHWHAL
jgi:hypothetical protein